jgi:hypothetical protein
MMKRSLVLGLVLAVSSVGMASTVTTISANGSGCVSSGSMIGTMGDTLNVGAVSWANYRSYLNFAGASSLSGKTVQSAVLYLDYTYSYATELPLSITVSSLSSDWSSTTTWDTQPVVAEECSVVSLGGNSSLGWYTWDVTSGVQDWADGTLSNYSLLVKGDEGSIVVNPGYQVLKFFASANSTAVPYLAVTYTPEPATIGLLGMGLLALLRKRK